MNTPQFAVPGAERPKNGILPLVLAGVGLLLCCLPLGAVGAIQAGSALREAKAKGQQPSSLLAVAQVLGWLSVVLAVGAYGFGVKSYLDGESAKKALQDSVATQRSGTTLEQQVACTLAKAELMKNAAAETVRCDQPLVTKGNRAVLPKVIAKGLDHEITATVCFAKAKRWFVLETLETGECSTRELDLKLKGLPTGDSAEDLERAEELFRKDEKVFKRYVRLVELKNRLSKTRDALSETIPTTCPDLAPYLQGEKKEIPYVEFSWMKKGAKLDEAGRLSFMTKKEVRDVLLNEGSDGELTKALDSIEGAPLFVAFAPKEKPVWPSPRPGGFLSGDYTGSIFLVDSKTSKPLCEKPFHFENGDTIKVRRSRLGVTSQSKLEDQLAADFEEHFEDAATASLKEIAGDKLKLGMSWME